MPGEISMYKIVLQNLKQIDRALCKLSRTVFLLKISLLEKKLCIFEVSKMVAILGKI
jgi:hypothetical protein